MEKLNTYGFSALKKLVLALSVFLSASLMAQSELDSLFSVWENNNLPDTVRFEAMQNYINKGYLYSQPDSAFYLSELAITFAKTRGMDKQMADALHSQGLSLYFQSDYNGCIEYFLRSLSINEKSGDNYRIAKSLNNIGVVYFRQGNYAKAIEYYTKTLSINEKIGDKEGVARTLNNIGLIHDEQNEHLIAIDYYKRSLELKKERNNNNYANTLNNIGLAYSKQDDFLNAMDYYSQSLWIRENINDKVGIASSLVSIGDVYRKQDNDSSAHTFYQRSLSVAKETGNKRRIINALIGLGKVYIKQRTYAAAITVGSEALLLAQNIDDPHSIKNASNILYTAYKKEGNFKSSLSMFELFISMEDSLTNENNQREVIRQGFKYEYEKQAIADSVTNVQIQKAQEAKLEKSRIQQYALIGGMILLLVFLGYVYNRYRVTSKQKLVISEQNKQLAIATENANTANDALKTKSEELVKFNNQMLDREMRIIELKEEVNKLAKSGNLENPYPEVEDV